jgi:hypothetical protein
MSFDVVLAALLRRALPKVSGLMVIGSVDGEKRARTLPQDAGRAIGQPRTGLGIEPRNRLIGNIVETIFARLC